jgi:hypothetical protein
MYKIISEETGQVLDVFSDMSSDIIRREAEFFKCSVYAEYRGEHSGYAATYPLKYLEGAELYPAARAESEA